MFTRFALVSLMVATSTAQAQPLSLGTVEVVQSVGGTNVAFPVALSLDVSTTAAGVQFAVVADMDMGHLQRSFDGVVKSFSLPRDNCPSYGQHVLPRVESATLSGEGSRAHVSTKINVAIWDCQAGLPSMTVEWRRPCGWCPKIPRVTVHRGSDIKNRLWRDDVDGRFDLSLGTPDGQSIELHPSNVNVSPRSDPARWANAIASVFGSSLSSVARAEIQKLVSSGAFRQALPAQFSAYSPAISQAHFHTAADGTLHASVRFTAVLTGEQLGTLIRDALARRVE